MAMESESDKVGFDIFVLCFFGSFCSLALWLCEILAGEQRDSVVTEFSKLLLKYQFQTQKRASFKNKLVTDA
jgi:hypothetical protein